MKMDFDTIIYIIISIAILVLSGLGGARKRKAQQLKTNTDSPGSATPGPSTMDRLEQMFTGQMGFESPGQAGIPVEDEIMEEEPPLAEVLPEQEKETKPRLGEEKVITDYAVEDPDQSGEEEQKDAGMELFGDLDEIKKAVIYSEVFKRKYS
jgi:hypothetical protein